ncbi:MAG: hypothetical protein LBV42_01270 [Methanobrevibacter sp.]|jgi:hypothetical protein|nr:hypothetical protein [Methanobrevibacter sp.]
MGNIISSKSNDLTKAIEKSLDLIKFSDELNIIMPIFSKLHLNTIFKFMILNEGKLEIITNKKISKLLFNSYHDEI